MVFCLEKSQTWTGMLCPHPLFQLQKAKMIKHGPSVLSEQRSPLLTVASLCGLSPSAVRISTEMHLWLCHFLLEVNT